MPTDRTAVLPLVIADLHARIAQGIATYGEPLYVETPIDQLASLYEELLDACLYLRAYRAQQPAFVMGALVAYRPYHVPTAGPNAQHYDANSWDVRPWIVTDIWTHQQLGRPDIIQYGLSPHGWQPTRYEGHRPLALVNRHQLRAWTAPAQGEEAPDD